MYRTGTILCCCLAAALLAGSCRNAPTRNPETGHSGSARYARGYTVTRHGSYTDVSVRNPWDTTVCLQRYLLVPRNRPLPDSLPAGTVIRTPLERVAVFNALHCSILQELQRCGSVTAVCESRYIHVDSIQDGLAAGTVRDLGESFLPDLEQLQLIRPEAVILSPIRDAGFGGVERTGIPVIACTDYLENTPLGQTEWIRFLALFFEQEKRADSLFAATCTRYDSVRELTRDVAYRPSVFSEMKTGPVWYVAGGGSFMAHLFADAGANYVWRDDPSTGAQPLSFEKVFEQAAGADFWLIKYYQPHDITYAELQGNYDAYRHFKAFRERNVFGCNTNDRPYYEELPLYPDRVLADFVSIFHPDRLPEYRRRYYKPLEE